MSLTCKNLEEDYERASSTLPKLGRRAPKVGTFAANLCGYFEFGRGGTRSLMTFPEVFASSQIVISTTIEKHEIAELLQELKQVGNTVSG